MGLTDLTHPAYPAYPAYPTYPAQFCAKRDSQAIDSRDTVIAGRGQKSPHGAARSL